MKKTLLLSVVASTMIMAGGDIAPVEPVVETPVVAEASGWDFSGQAVVYYQTRDNAVNDLFDQEASAADAGLQLRAVNKDVFAGIGAGFEVNGLSTLNLENSVVSNVPQGVGKPGDIDDMTDGGWISQAYLTYGFGNTSFKLGRQELPKALSPFAFSEGWNVFKNTFDAALVVNTDLPDTTIVYAYVYGGNHNGFGAGNDLSDFNKFNDHDGIHMLTVQNKSVEGLTLTGSYYYAPNLDQANGNDAHILWGDAKYAISDYAVALQGGYIFGDAVDNHETTSFGAKVGGNFGMFDASLAYSYVGDEDMAATVTNFGGVKTPLYTQMILNQGVIENDSQYIKVAAGAKALGGKFGVAYGQRLAADNDILDDHNPYELDVTYKTKVFNDSTTLFAGYVLTDADDNAVNNGDSQNMIRVWGRYNF
ncbi:hypothetical protein MNB_SV-8-54 [hydrothermal vent metagenome]|uniref:Outer membrane porin n=1 Tax=hydrothermal vent metagenome TaxID=652676 RepID=A0A1W1C2A6_9ZZZZ